MNPLDNNSSIDFPFFVIIALMHARISQISPRVFHALKSGLSAPRLMAISLRKMQTIHYRALL